MTITVYHPGGSYPIHLRRGLLERTGAYLARLGYAGRCALVTNETVGPLYAEAVLDSLASAGFDPIRLDVPDGEQHKTLATVNSLYSPLVEAKLDRNSPILALGGGVLGDTAGFVAASFLRGVPLVQIPTTLLAIVDSSVGGKTGVDLPQGKNLVGAFKQPVMVIVDPAVLDSLPPAEFTAGMAEVVKHGIIDAPKLFDALEADDYDILWMLQEAIKVKVRVVEADPFEAGLRAVLNLGHTFAHAFERLAHFKMRHGEAVGIGLVCAAELAARLGHCAPQTTARIVRLVGQLGLPVQVPAYAPVAIWQAMSTDKKRQGDQLPFILPRDIGDVDIFHTIPPGEVLTMLSDLQEDTLA